MYQLIIAPLDVNGDVVTNSSWDLEITDSDNHLIDDYTTVVGRHDCREYLPVGRDTAEKYTLSFSNVTNTPATIQIIFKIRETNR